MAVLALRKLWRLTGTLFPLTYYFTNKITTLFVLLPILTIFIFLELLRRFSFRFNEKLFVIFSFLLKEKEKKGLLATTWFLLSVLLSVILFRKGIAITAILFLIFADMASSFFGAKFGRIRILGSRTLEGSLAFLAACLMIGVILSFTEVGLPARVVVVGALAATLTEALPIPIDDNFTIALFSGIIMTLLSKT